MIMKRLSFTITIIALSLTSLMAQTAVDALRYSRIIPGGTARFVSMGGSFGALGGDFSMLSTNPGGIGLYKSSEFTLTPSVFAGSTRTDYRGIENKDYRVNFNG